MYEFGGWLGDVPDGVVSTTNPIAIHMDGTDKALTGTFKFRTINLTFPDPPSGTIDVEPPGPWEWGDVVTITATPDDGMCFVGWTGDLVSETQPVVVITLTEDLDFDVIFEECAANLLVGQVGLGRFGSFDNVTLTVKFVGVGDVVVDVDANGVFTVAADAIDVAPGAYDVGVKDLRTMAICQSGVDLPAVDPPVEFLFDGFPVFWPDGGLYQGDLNGDDTINMLDFSTWAGIFNGGTPKADKRGDLNNDGTVNMLDFSVFAGQFAGGQTPVGGDCWTP
jgi:hypothetical protein